MSYVKHTRGRKDSNHTLVRDAALALGWYVIDLAELGGGVPDLLCLRGGAAVFLEVKAPGGTVSDGQAEAHGHIRAAGCRAEVVWSVDDAIAALGAERRVA